MATNIQGETVVGVLAVDRELVITLWDEELSRLTGVPAARATGKRLVELFPDLQTRGLLERFHRVIGEGVVDVLAPVFHGYIFASPPNTPSKWFQKMQQRATIAPLLDGENIIGALVTIEDVTARMERERELAEQLASGDPAIRLKAVEDLASAAAAKSTESIVGIIGDEDWRVRRAAVKALTHRVAPEAIAALLRLVRENHRNFSLLNSALRVLAMSKIDTVTPLLGFLNDPDAGLRMQAALVLGERGDERAVSTLTQALEDPDTNVRYHAIEALGKIHASSAAEVLIRIAESRDFFLAFPALDALKRIGDTTAATRILPLLVDEMLCEPAAEALGELGDETVVGPLVESLNTKPTSAAAVARALARLHDRMEELVRSGECISDSTRLAIRAEGVQNLLQSLETARNDEIGPIAKVLGWLEGAAVDKALTHLLAHPAARKEVVEALVRHGKPVIDLLIQQLATGDVETRRAAVAALGRIGDPRATPDVVRVLTDEDELKVAAADALAKIGDERAFEPLLKMIDHPDPSVRLAVIGALNSLGTPKMQQKVMAMLADADPLVRESAVKIAGYFGYEGSATALIDSCHDPDERVRRAAVGILPYVEDSRVLDTLSSALRGDTPIVRAAAATALGHVQSDQSRRRLTDALKDEDSWVRYFAARSLGRHGSADSLDELASVAENDRASYVRIASIEAIAEIGGTHAAELIRPFMQAENIDVVQAATASYNLVLSRTGKTPQ